MREHSSRQLAPFRAWLGLDGPYDPPRRDWLYKEREKH